MTWRLLRTWSDPEMQRKAVWVCAMMNASEASAADLEVSPEAIVGQAAQETGWGKSKVGKHNQFGIKVGTGWAGERVLASTFEWDPSQQRTIYIQDWFRDYPNDQASVDDHLAFLQRNANYRAAGVFDGMGDEHYFKALQKAGYATDPEYAAHLLAMRDSVHNYFLKYMSDDDTVTAHPYVPVATPKVRWLMLGDSGEDVLALQRALGTYYHDKLDGWFGKNTKDALKDWQKTHPPLQVDGVAGTETQVSLGLVKG